MASSCGTGTGGPAEAVKRYRSVGRSVASWELTRAIKRLPLGSDTAIHTVGNCSDIYPTSGCEGRREKSSQPELEMLQLLNYILHLI